MRLHSDQGHGAPWCVWQQFLSRLLAQLPSWAAVSSGGANGCLSEGHTETLPVKFWSFGGLWLWQASPAYSKTAHFPLHARPPLRLSEYSIKCSTSSHSCHITYLSPLISWPLYILSLQLTERTTHLQIKFTQICKKLVNQTCAVWRTLEDVDRWHKLYFHVMNYTKSSWNKAKV